VKKRDQQKHGLKKVRAKRFAVVPEQPGSESALSPETQNQLRIGRKIMAKYREVLENLAKS
jgi:hypothetical protein